MAESRFEQTLKQLGNDWVSAYAQGAERVAAWLGEAGRAPASGLPRRYADFALKEGPRVARRLAEASLAYYAAVLGAGADSVNRFYDDVLKASPPSAAPAKAAPKSKSALLFHGTAGTTASNAFLVTNHRGTALDIRFEVSELASGDGTARRRVEASFAPENCRLEAGADKVVQCSLALPADLSPDSEWHGRILVANLPELAMDIRVRVEPAAKAA